MEIKADGDGYKQRTGTKMGSEQRARETDAGWPERAHK